MVSAGNVAFHAGGESQQNGIYLFDGTTLTTVMDFNTPIPGGTGNFTRILSVYPAVSDRKVAFHAGDWNGEGIYLFDGTSLKVVADTNTPIPGGSGNFMDFVGFYSPVISGNNIAFIGEGPGQLGVYLFNGSSLKKVADYNTPVPEGSGNFNSFSSPAISGDNIVFQGGSDTGLGIYLFNSATLLKVVDYNTPIPGGSGNFSYLSDHQVISGGNVAFRAGNVNTSGIFSGIYLFNGTTLSKVADYNTPIPGGSGNFSSFSNPVISGNNVAFWGNGIYLFDGTALRVVADTNTPIPGGPGNFSFQLSDPVISNGNVAFHAAGGVEGIYLFNGTNLCKVADINTPVPNGSGNFTGFFDPVIDDDEVVFLGSWGTDEGGVYLATSTAGWTISTIDSEGDVGWFSSIAVDSNNKAHISYVDATNGDLKYATNASGSWQELTVDSLGDVGPVFSSRSIAIDSNNKIHISYYDATNGYLKYATDVSGSWETFFVDNTWDVGRYASIAIDSNNRVHISYCDNASYDLKYATNASGSWETFILDSPGIVGKSTSITIDSDNNVHISYHDRTNHVVKYATNTSGLWMTSVIDGATGEATSIAVDSNNRVYMSYSNGTSSDLKYATNVSGTWETFILGSAGYADYSSIAIDLNDKIHISYTDLTNADLKYATNASGSWEAFTLDSDGYTGLYTSIAIDSNDKVHISYYDETNGDLKYATNACTVPMITTQPQSQTILSGQTQSISVSASGATPFTYQWYRGSGGDTSNPLSGATSRDYTTPTLTQTTSYWVRVTNPCGSADSNTATVTVVSARISIASPNGGETLSAGSTQTIRWSYDGNPGFFVKIELLKGGIVNRTVSSFATKGTGGTGSYNWMIPSDQAPGIDYRVRVTSTSIGAYTDVSDSNFTIAAPTITLVSPNGGDSWAAGATKTIQWSYVGNSGSFVKIELLKAGAVSSTISYFSSIGSAGTGSYNWSIPSTLVSGSDYRIKITSTTNGTCTDISDTYFNIVGPPPPTISVVSPNGGESFTAGTTKTIQWSYGGNPGSFLKVELLKSGVLISTISYFSSIGSGGTGTYNWSIPSTLGAGSDYQIKITSTTNGSCTDVSDTYFNIVGPPLPTIAVVSPHGGETWTAGTIKTVQWSYNGNPGSFVRIELLKAGAVSSTISYFSSIGSAGNGSFNWSIPSNLVSGNDYRIKITSITNGTCTDVSDSYFTILGPP